MSAIPSREVTSTQVAGITFGFYSDDEVSQCSNEWPTHFNLYTMLFMTNTSG